MHRAKFIDLGLKDYKEAWDYQQEIQQHIINDKIAGDAGGEHAYLLYVEHPHVYTLGKSGKENNLLINPDFLQSIHAKFYRTDRGGDITYHGPGQLVGYPIFDLDSLGIGVKVFIHHMEQAVISTLADNGIKAGRLEGATGVWLEAADEKPVRKICAIGVKVSRGVTMHGFALNVNTDLNYFSYINPCGFTDKGVTSIEKETGKKAGMEAVKKVLAGHIAREFGLDFKP